MKKLFVLAAIGSVCFFYRVSAQQASRTNASEQYQLSDRDGGPGPMETIPAKAVRLFRMLYGDAANAEWIGTKDNGLVCRFDWMTQQRTAYFNKKGNWLYTIAGCLEDQLPANVRDIAKRNYYDYAFGYSHEISFPGNKTVYLITMQRKDTIKLLRIEGDDLEEIDEFTNK
jgi:hypothetical protein